MKTVRVTSYELRVTVTDLAKTGERVDRLSTKQQTIVIDFDSRITYE